MRRRAGFTLIELLVIIAILGTLMALLIPAVQRVRESGNQAACRNNLRQVVLALQANAQTNFSFPPVSTTSPSHTFYAEILGNLEQRNVGFNITQNWNSGSNLVASQRALPMLFCPSVPEDPSTRRDISNNNAAVTDYSGLGNPAGTTAMRPNVRTEFTLIKDGLSNTLLVVEDAGRPVLYVAGIRAGVVTSASGWAVPGNELAGLSTINQTNDHQLFSFHPGGAMVGFCDASVRFLNDSISPGTLNALSTRAGSDDVNPKEWQ